MGCPINVPVEGTRTGVLNVEGAGGLDLSAHALEFLEAVSAGEDRAVELAATLATRLLDETGEPQKDRRSDRASLRPVRSKTVDPGSLREQYLVEGGQR